MKPILPYQKERRGRKNIAYTTDRKMLDGFGGRQEYNFNGWDDGDKPSQTYDVENYVACLHGISLALTILNDHKRSHEALEDDGVIHEVVHLMHLPFIKGLTKYELNSHKQQLLKQDFRGQLVQLENDALGEYERIYYEQHKDEDPKYRARRIGYDFGPGLDLSVLKIDDLKPEDLEVPPQRFYTYDIADITDYAKYPQARYPVRPYVAQQKGLQKEDYKIVFSPDLKSVHPNEPVHLEVLQRTGEEETGAAPGNSEAERSLDLRDGDTGQVSMHSLQQTGEVQSD